MMNALMLAQSSDSGSAGGGMLFLLIELAIIALVIVGFWKVFSKAGQPGWFSLIPIFNVFILLKIVGRPWWWLILLLIPIVNFIIMIVVSIDVAKSFGKSLLFGIGLAFLSPIFYCILGFGDAQYRGPAAA